MTAPLDPKAVAAAHPWPWQLRLAIAVVIGAAGGAVANWLKLPLAWMIGAMIATTVASIAGMPLTMAPRFRGIMVAVLGVMLGSAFSPAIAARIPQWWPTLAALSLYCVIVSALLMVYFRFVARYDWVTCYFSAAPGGLNEMVVVGEEMGGDVRTISLVHGARILLVVMIVPFGFVLFGGYDRAAQPPAGDAWGAIGLDDAVVLFGCAVIGTFIARRIRMPAAFVTGPMILSAAAHLSGITASKPPTELVAAAQVVIGVGVGSRFSGIAVRKVVRTLIEAVGATVVMLGVTAGFALALRPLAETSFAALVLAFAPGGLAEMSLIALALAIDAAFVSSHHIMRIIMVVILAPLAFRWRARKRATGAEDTG